MAESDWVSAHVFCQGNQDDLLTDLVRPLVHQWRQDGLVSACFFLRHWDGGPHVRLRIATCDEAAHIRIQEYLESQCTAYLAAHPSEDQLNPQAFAAIGQHLARWEGIA